MTSQLFYEYSCIYIGFIVVYIYRIFQVMTGSTSSAGQICSPATAATGLDAEADDEATTREAETGAGAADVLCNGDVLVDNTSRPDSNLCKSKTSALWEENGKKLRKRKTSYIMNGYSHD